ncbi:hypothetical protein ABIA43_003161 [Bradyrhizobium sp. USDA 328]
MIGDQCGMSNARLECQVGATLSLPPPLWGRGGEGGSPGKSIHGADVAMLACGDGPRVAPPSLTLPHKGGGNERAVPVSHAKFWPKFLNDSKFISTVHGVVFDLLTDGSRP